MLSVGGAVGRDLLFDGGRWVAVVVGPAEEPVFPQRELVPGQQLPRAGHAPEALHVVDLVARPHHEVVPSEAHAAPRALYAEQPVKEHRAVNHPLWKGKSSVKCCYNSWS